MKFSIAFKYSNVTFKNKETKETVTYDSKAEGNSFAFDNVDEDVVIGMVKGIKNKKASEVFSFDNLRTNFINVIARNKCKELYDKLEKDGWKVEDVAISNITIKDLEFTKPTMNARETITVESRKKIKESGVSPKFKEGDKVAWYDPKDETILHGGVVTDVYDNISCFMYKVWFEDEELSEVIDEEDLDYDTVYESKNMKTLNTTREHFEKSEYYTRKYGKLKFMSESGDKFKTDKGHVIKFNEAVSYGLSADELDRELDKELEEEPSDGSVKEGDILCSVHVWDYDRCPAYYKVVGVSKKTLTLQKLKNKRIGGYANTPDGAKMVPSDVPDGETIRIRVKPDGSMCEPGRYGSPISKWDGKPISQTMMNESDFDEDEPEYFGDGQLHVFDYGEDYKFCEQYIVMYPSGSVLYTNDSGSVSYWDDVDTMSYSTQSEMEDNFATGSEETEDLCVPSEVKDFTSLPNSLKKLII